MLPDEPGGQGLVVEGADLLALGVVAVLAVAHVVPPSLAFVELRPRSWLLSAAAGVSVAYVFVHLLPEIAEAQETVEEQSSGFLAGFERHAYVVALVGLAVFYGLERAAVTSKHSRREAGHAAAEEEPTSPGAFWTSMGSFAVYNAIIGYLVVQRAEEDSAGALALFTGAIALHFLINDLGLRSHHRRRYDRLGRPLLTAAILLGWVVGVTTQLSEAAVGLAIAFLAGGVVLNVMKEEVPSEQESRFLPLAAGAAVYATLLLAV
ncbi:MAG: hypothetical protein M3503_07280 [Actinomycetota bacterium]|nr:hypothetical protein [Actinomycetota bacterium]